MNYESDLAAHLRWKTAPTKVAYTGTANRTAALAPGLYYATSDQDCYILQGDSTVTATTSSIPLWAKTYVPVRVRKLNDDTDEYVSAVQISAGGTLWLIPADA